MKISDKTKTLITSLTAWVGTGAVIIETFFGCDALIISATTGTASALVTIENFWFKAI
jgi:hypothetical protein